MGWKMQVIITSLIMLCAIVLESSAEASSPPRGATGEVDAISPENIDKELEELQEELDFLVKKEQLLTLKEKITHLKEDSHNKEPLFDETTEQLRHRTERLHTISDLKSQSESECPESSTESLGHHHYREHIDLDMAACLKELNLADEMQKKVENHVKRHGMRGLNVLLTEHLSEYENSKVSIAVTGETGAGKSTLINTMRNMKPYEKGSAKVGITETTKERTPYSFPNLPNIILWDLPGIDGSTTFSKNRYIDRVKLASYDALLIVCSGRFKQNDIWIAKKAKENKIPYYLIRSKINLDVDNERADNPNHDETKLLKKLQTDLESKLDEHDLETSKIFLVSGKLEHNTLWDFPGLMRNLTQDTPGKKREALAVAIASSSTDIIQMKKNHCASRIDEVALQVAASDDMITTLMKEINSYSYIFGISTDDQIKWKSKFENLNDENQKIMELLNDISLKLKEENENKFKVDGQKAIFKPTATYSGGLAGLAKGPLGSIAGALIGLVMDATYYYVDYKQIEELKERIATMIEKLKRKQDTKGEEKESLRMAIMKEAKSTLREILNYVANLSIEILNQSIQQADNIE